MFLVHQFETLDFNFVEIVDKEELLQEKYEKLQAQEIMKTGKGGAEHVLKNQEAKKAAAKANASSRGKSPEIANELSTVAKKQNKRMSLREYVDPDESLPYVQRQMQKKSYLGEACNIAIKEALHKIQSIDRNEALITKQKYHNMKEKIKYMNDDVAAYREQSDVFENNLDSLLKINSMYQDTIKQLESVIKVKEDIITDHLNTIAKLTEGSAQELMDIKMMFYSKQQELVDTVQMWRDKFNKANE